MNQHTCIHFSGLVNPVNACAVGVNLRQFYTHHAIELGKAPCIKGGGSVHTCANYQNQSMTTELRAMPA